jgi:hypothetical protein
VCQEPTCNICRSEYNTCPECMEKRKKADKRDRKG